MRRQDLRLESPQLIEEPNLAKGAVDDEDLGGEGVARVLVKQPILVLFHHLWDDSIMGSYLSHPKAKEATWNGEIYYSRNRV